MFSRPLLAHLTLTEKTLLHFDFSQRARSNVNCRITTSLEMTSKDVLVNEVQLTIPFRANFLYETAS